MPYAMPCYLARHFPVWDARRSLNKCPEGSISGDDASSRPIPSHYISYVVTPFCRNGRLEGRQDSPFILESTLQLRFGI